MVWDMLDEGIKYIWRNAQMVAGPNQDLLAFIPWLHWDEEDMRLHCVQ